MSKSNNKKNRTKGTIISGNIEYPDPIRTQNNPADGGVGFSDKARIGRNSRENNKY